MVVQEGRAGKIHAHILSTHGVYGQSKEANSGSVACAGLNQDRELKIEGRPCEDRTNNKE